MDLNSTLKIVIAGDSLSGKTSLINRFVDNSFEAVPQNEVIDIDFRILKLSFGFREYVFQIWDTAGLEKYKSITRSYFHAAAAIIIALDSSDQTSLSKLDNWMLNIEDSSTEERSCKVYVALTKCDLESQIDLEFLKIITERYGLKYFEVSAKTGANVNTLFEEVIHESLVLRNKAYLVKKAEVFRTNDSSLMNNTSENSTESVSDTHSQSYMKHSLKKTEIGKSSKCRC